MEKFSKPLYSEAVVSGAMAVLLHGSRIIGLAPLTFTKIKEGWRINVSRGWSVYGYVMTVLNSLFCISILLIPGHVYRVWLHNNTHKSVWFFQVLLMMVTAATAVFSSPWQMKALIDILGQVQKINSALGVHHFPKAWSRKMSVTLLTQISLCVTISSIEIFKRGISILGRGHSFHVAVFATGSYYYIAYWTIQVRNLQFIAIVLFVKHSFKILNDQLENVLENLETEEMNFEKTTVINNYVSIINNSEKKILTHEIPLQKCKPESPQTRVRALALSFAQLCDIVRKVDRCQGVIVLLMLANFFLHLIFTPYCFLGVMIHFGTGNAKLLGIEDYFFLVILFWCFFHTYNLVMTVEPCDRTYSEIERTRELVCQLMRCSHSPLYSPLALQLDQFYSYLQLNNVLYRPLKLVTMTRPLIITILGSITTYIVIMLQL